VKLKLWFERWLVTRNRETLSRFNKTFGASHREFGTRLGQLIASAAAAGTLRSGSSIRQAYRELDAVLEHSIDDCLTLVSKKTQHVSRKRRWLLEQLKVQVRHHGKHLNDQIRRSALGDLIAAGDTAAAAERLFGESLAIAIDRVDRYADGLTAPDDISWPVRHPMLASLALAMVTAIAAEVWGVVDFIP